MAFSFGAPPPAAPAPASGGFGSAPTPAPAGGLFGTPAPAPAAPAPGGGLFGTPAAPGVFGTTLAATAPGFTATASPTVAVLPSQQQQQQQPISTHTPYSQLPENAKRALDAIHDLMMRHRRTMMGVQSMAPALLLTEATVDGGGRLLGGGSKGVIGSGVAPADAAAGPPSPALGGKTSFAGPGGDPDNTPLPRQISSLRSQMSSLAGRVERSLSDASHLRAHSEKLCQGAIMHAAWPIEAVAVRRGVLLRQPSHRSGEARRVVEGTLGHLLDVQASAVDRIERMPSPYLWDTIRELQECLEAVRLEVDSLSDRLSVAERSHEEGALLALPGAGGGAVGFGPHDTSAERVASVVRAQSDAFVRVAAAAARAHDDLERLRARYRRAAASAGYAGDDPFARADAREAEEERRVQDQIRSGVASAAAAGVTAASAPTPVATVPAPGAAPGAFGALAPAPSSAGGLFGTTTPAPAPVGGGLFGTPAPAPAPAGGLFGATTPAPTPSGGLFGTPTPAPAAGGGGLFGSAAPAPSTSGGFGGFGATAPAATGAAAAPAPSFGNPPTRSKSKSRSGRRR